MNECLPKDRMIEERIDRILTQYRESPNLLFLARHFLGTAVDALEPVCALPEAFDLDTATGDQLTLIGKRLGWGRCHCICDVEPVFGFDCVDDLNRRPIVGFCEPSSTWENCSTTGVSEVCLADDEIYRRFLKVRVYQFLNRYDLPSFEECLQLFFGPTASVLYAGEGRIVIAPGRDLTDQEILFLQLYPRVLPIALGIRVTFHFGSKRVFGFGEGWGGFMEPDTLKTQETIAFQRTGKVFGFCESEDETIGGFCEEWAPEGLPIETDIPDLNGGFQLLVDENENPIYTGPLKQDAAWLCRSDAPWMCEIDVRPYDC